jgi:hypothetical protein
MIVRRSVASGGIAQSLRHVDSPCVSPHDFPKNVHSSVSRHQMEGKMLVVPNLRVVKPNNIFRKVPTRRPNAEMRTREYLTPAEVEKLIAAAKLGRHGHRDATLILVAFRHGLRAVRDRRSGMVASRMGSQSGAARPQGEERQARSSILSGVMNCACCASCGGIRRVRSSSRLSAGGRSRRTPSTAS